MWWIILVIIVIVVGGILGGRHEIKKTDERTEKLKTKLQSIANFNVSKQVNGINNFYIFAIDNVNNKLALITEVDNYIVNYSDIIAVELLQNDITIQQKSATRTLGGAVIGGILAGGAGAVVGGLSGSSVNQNKVSSLHVKILLRNVGITSLIVKCFDSLPMAAKREAEVSDPVYKIGKGHADTIKDLVGIAIDKIDQENQSIRISDNPTSASDELVKLHNLKEKGILTEDEFLVEKRKILNRKL